MAIPLTLFYVGVTFGGCLTSARAIHASAGDDGRCRGVVRTDIDTCFPDGGCCPRPVLLKEDVVVGDWYGRIGNNLIQVAHAIFVAKLSGKRSVTLPSSDVDHFGVPTPIGQMFKFPQRLDIELDEEFKSRASCSESTGFYYLLACRGVVRADYTSVLRAYVLPHLAPEARGACEREASNTKHELVIHLRSGDAMFRDPPHPQKSRFAPCAFFEAVADEAEVSFEGVRVITEPDQKHPCLGFFREKNWNFTVQSESLVADGCAFMHADHLAVGAKSTFSDALSMFNPNPVTLYDPFNCHKKKGGQQCSKSGASSIVTRVDYCVDQIEKVRMQVDRTKWMLEYPRDHVLRDKVVCI
mmetsp:Transcript_4622/g.12136  ORF Transcript_4622/g.12136 Transcript_4622/m.12136 type:complete len:355 (-) Transcript_4622:386-1450(-)